MFAKRRKIDGKSIRLRISIQPRDNFAFFLFRRRLGVDLARPEVAWEPTGRPFGSPKNPWGVLSLPRGALGALTGRTGDAPRRSRNASGAHWMPRGRYWVPRMPRGTDFWSFLASIMAWNSTRVRADFCNWWARPGRNTQAEGVALAGSPWLPRSI